MKKKIILSLLVIVALFTITGCGNETKSNQKPSNGFQSNFIQGKDNDIEKYPTIKNKALELESKFIDKKLKVNKINFEESTNQLIVTYYFNNGNDKLFNYYSLNKDSNEFEFYSFSTMIYDDNTYKVVRDIIVNDMNFTDEELLEINNVSKNGDYVRIRGYKYLVDYEENEDSNGLMKKFRIMIQG